MSFCQLCFLSRLKSRTVTTKGIVYPKNTNSVIIYSQPYVVPSLYGNQIFWRAVCVHTFKVNGTITTLDPIGERKKESYKDLEQVNDDRNVIYGWTLDWRWTQFWICGYIIEKIWPKSLVTCNEAFYAGVSCILIPWSSGQWKKMHETWDLWPKWYPHLASFCCPNHPHMLLTTNTLQGEVFLNREGR